MTKKFYAVKIGKKIGVFNNWNDAKKHVDGVSGAIYKSFSTLIEAKAFLKQTQSQTPKVLTGPIAYVDGSYFEKYKKYGSGVYIRDANDSKTLKQYSFSGKKIEFLSARNVAGECLASLKAMEWALANNIKSLNIVYDYTGIANWTMGWKTNSAIAIFYKKEFADKYLGKLKVNFIKVKGHSGNAGNEKADELAKQSVIKHN